MNLIRAATELNPGNREVCIAIGFFDGLHLGHQQVIRQTIGDALQREGLSVVVTFDRHPSSVVSPNDFPGLIYPLEKKLAVIESLGCDAIYLISFDQDFSQIPAEKFVRDLAHDFKQLRSISVGNNFTFGHKQSGNVSLLRLLGSQLGFSVHAMASVALDNAPVSSTRVRASIRSGDFDLAAQLLGRPYALCGRVVKGDQLGRTLGFPTANLDPTGLVLPPTGVYAVHARVGRETHRAVMNIGHRPTLNSPAPRLQVEAHLLDFEHDIYGEEVELTIVSGIRPERQFASLSELKQQIAKDVGAATKMFAAR